MDAKLGSLSVHLDTPQCFSAEMYSADLNIVGKPEDDKVPIYFCYSYEDQPTPPTSLTENKKRVTNGELLLSAFALSKPHFFNHKT